MRTDFTNIRTALNTLVDSIAEMHTNLLAKANAERAEALELYARMCDTRADIVDFGNMVADVADQFVGINDVAGDIANKIDDAITDGFLGIPECNYEDFVGFCAVCGKTITEYDVVDFDGEEFFCADCIEGEDELEDEDELVDEPVDEEEPEQLELPIEEAAPAEEATPVEE